MFELKINGQICVYNKRLCVCEGVSKLEMRH